MLVITKKEKHGVQKQLLSTVEAVRAWGVTRYMLRKLVDEGSLVPVVLGDKNWKFHRDDYQDLILLKRDR